MPEEAGQWWSWRAWDPSLPLPGVQCLSLRQALDEYAAQCQQAQTLATLPAFPATAEPDDFWSPGSLPIFAIDSGILLIVDAAESNGTSAPIRLVDPQDAEDFSRVVAMSLGEYIHGIVDAIDAGDWTYDATRRLWREVTPR